VSRLARPVVGIQFLNMSTQTTSDALPPVDRIRLTGLLNRWRDEIAGWDEAANIAARGNESGVASRNRVRAHSIRGCVDDLAEIIETSP
jgi:hypothetical protein